MIKQKINVNGTEISIFHQDDNDYVSLTDMAKYRAYDSGVVISNWLTTKYTIQFMGAWEQLYNPDFNLMEFHKIKNEVGTNGFIVSSSMWIKHTKAIGIKLRGTLPWLTVTSRARSSILGLEISTTVPASARTGP